MYPGLTWHRNNSEKRLFLTFDDGPIPVVTENIILMLKQYDIRATFFCVGENIQKYPEVFERVKEAGHQVGNHTFHHLNGWKTDTEVYLENVERCESLTGSRLF